DFAAALEGRVLPRYTPTTPGHVRLAKILRFLPGVRPSCSNEGKLKELIAKADVLLEALPYMRRFAGRVVGIKYGGHAMLDATLKSGFAEDIVLLKSLGLRPVIVHGGGPQIEEALARLGIATRFVRGM